MCNKVMYWYYIKLYVFVILLCNSLVYGQGPIVNTTLGLVRGVVVDDGAYISFLGIPFGRVNEDNPFGEALPPQEFEGIFEANDDSAICPQREEFNHTLTGTLDCLHLNIHVPNTASSTNLRPVLVVIYGGGYTIGFYGRFLYGAKYLVRHDIVLVTLNYRLGPFGFMCLDIPEVPGNQGLKDQLMALRWLRDNISNFGGDPNMITISGNSAGSSSVEHHIMRENDGQDLFNQAILQSGTVLMLGNANHAKDAPIQLARHLGNDTNDIYEAIAFLARSDPLAIIETSLQLNLGGGPCAEREFESVEAFTTEDVSAVTEIPQVEGMNIIVGFNNDEMYSAGLNSITEANEVIVRNYLSILMDSQHPDFDYVVNSTRQFYFGDEVLNDDQVQNYVDLIGDVAFVHPIYRSTQRFFNNNAGNIYLYKFSYDGERNFVKHRESFVGGGAYHADELGYLFDISYMNDPNYEDGRVLDAMTAMWANFVKYGDPTPQTSELLPVRWPAITRTSPAFNYMNIDLELRVSNRPFRERMTYWDLFFDSYGNRETANENSAVL